MSGCSHPRARGRRPGTSAERSSRCATRSSPTTRASSWPEGDDGALIGICTAYQDLHSVRYGYRVWVEDLAVDPGRRSQGVGKALMDAARDWARERGATHLELDSALARTDAHRFYEREGADYKSFSFGWEL